MSQAAVKQRVSGRRRRYAAYLRRNFQYLLYAYVASMAIVVGALLDNLAHARFSAVQRGLVEGQAASLSAKIAGDLTSKAIMLRGLVALINRDPNMTQEQYAADAAELVYDDPGIKNIAAAPNLVVRYVYPESPNHSVLGFDYRTSPEQYPDVRRARDTGKTVIAGPINLIQGGTGFVIRTPVVRKDSQTGNRIFWGIVSAVVDSNSLFRAAGLTDPALPITVSLRHNEPGGLGGNVIFGSPSTFEDHPVLTKIDLPTGSWELAALPKGGWSTRGSLVWWLRAAYLAAVLVLFAALRYFSILLKRRRIAERRLQEAIDTLDDGFVLYDSNERLVVCNRKYRELYDSTPAELLVPGTPFERIIRSGVGKGQFAEDLASVDEWVNSRLAAYRSGASQTEQQLRDGRWLRVTDKRTPDGSTVGLRVDVTDLRNAMEVAQTANIAKSEFLNVLSHELRTPLTVIIGNARILSNHDGMPQIRRLREMLAKTNGGADLIRQTDTALTFLRSLAQKIEAPSQHLLHLITEMLDFSKIEAGKMELEIETIELHPVVESVLDGFKANAIRKGISLGCENCDAKVRVDKLRLTQILINLVGNAIKFTDAGEVKVASRTRGEMVEVSIWDTGCGIASDSLDLIFETFRQVDSSSTRKAGGTGLGLAITKRLVELHGGEISVSSTPNLGSVFRFTIPSAVVAARNDGFGASDVGRPSSAQPLS